jgi:hypothetical protein
MVSLSPQQTKTLNRIFKKIEFYKVAFDQTEDGNVIIVLQDVDGKVGRIAIGENGLTVK